MMVDPSNTAAGSRVTGAIRQASQATGASFNYLLATAQVESGLDPQAGVTVAKIDGKQFVGLRGIEWVSLGSEGPRKLCIS
jgi:hypothetical protein